MDSAIPPLSIPSSSSTSTKEATSNPEASSTPLPSSTEGAGKKERLLENIFKASIHPKPGYILLESVRAEKSATAETYWGRPAVLCAGDVEAILLERLSALDVEGGFRYLSDCYKRTADVINASGSDSSEGSRLSSAVQESLVDYAALLFQCSALFGKDEVPVAELSGSFNRVVTGGISQAYLSRMVDRIAANDADDVQRLFEPIFDELTNKLLSRSLVDQRTCLVRNVLLYLNIKPIARVVPLLECFLPKPPVFVRRGGYVLEHKSLLGVLLAITPIDGAREKRLADANYERYGMKMFDVPALTYPHLTQARNVIARDTNLAMQQAHQATLCLLRGSVDGRRLVCTWLGQVLSSMEGRVKLSHQATAAPLAMDGAVEFMTIIMSGEVSLGFALNVFWLLLKLAEPIKPDKIGDIDVSYLLFATATMGDWTQQSRLADREAVDRAKDYFNRRVVNGSFTEHKFVTEVLWLSAKGISVLANPLYAEFFALCNALERLPTRSPTDSKFRRAFAELLSFKAILLDPNFCSSLWVLVHLVIQIIIYNLYRYNSDGSVCIVNDEVIKQQKGNLSTVVLQCTPPSPYPTLSPQLCCLPARLTEDIFDLIFKLLDLHSINQHSELGPKQRHASEPLVGVDWELVLAFAVCVMSHSQHFTNVHARCSASNAVARLLQDEWLRSLMETSVVARETIVSALTVAFIDSQKANYYERLNYRLPMMETLSTLLQIEIYRKQFKKTVVQQKREMFVHFLHLLLSDLSWLMEEAMLNLAAVHRREIRGGAVEPGGHSRNAMSPPSSTIQNVSSSSTSDSSSSAVSDPPPMSGRGTGLYPPQTGDTAVSLQTTEGDMEGGEEEMDREGENPPEDNVERMPFRRLQERTRVFVSLTHKSCTLLWRLAAYFGSAMVQSSPVLTQVVTCLDCCLHHLVGPRGLELKVKNNSDYAFDPKDLLSKVCETYIHLASAVSDGNDVLLKEICEDQRYYRTEIFRKAVRILRRESILLGKTFEAFSSLVGQLTSFQEEWEQLLATGDEDVPDEYLDPIMQDIMVEPVRLPTSGTVMDRRHIERHLMSDEHDPYNRAPLRVDMLEPLPELKGKIGEYLKQLREKKRQAIDAASSENE